VLKPAWGEDYEKAAGFAGEIAPAMAGSLWNGDASARRYIKHLILECDAVQAGDDDEVLFFVAMKMHWRSAAWFSERLYDRIGTIRLKARNPHCNTLASSSFIPRAAV
jgi:hypothetical protein